MKNNALLDTINNELINLDMFGLIKSRHTPQNEFEIERDMIYQKLKVGMTKQQIAQVIAKVFNEMFGENFKTEEFYKTANVIEQVLNNSARF